MIPRDLIKYVGALALMAAATGAADASDFGAGADYDSAAGAESLCGGGG